MLILVAIAGGVAFAVGKTRFEAPGPLDQEKVVNIPSRLGLMDIAEVLRREGVMDEHPAVFLGGVAGAFVVLTLEDSIPGWLLGVVLIRDIVIVSGYFLFAFFTGERPPMRPTVLGKASTFLQLLCVLGALARISSKWPLGWNALLDLTLIMTASAGLHYAYQGLRWLSTREPEMFE